MITDMGCFEEERQKDEYEVANGGRKTDENMARD